MAWKKAFEAQKPYGPKFAYAAKKKKKKKKKNEAKEKKKTQEPVVPKLKIKKKSAPASVASINNSEQQNNEKNNEAASTTSPQAEENLEIRSSLYTRDTVEDYIPPGRPFPYRPLQRYTTNIKNYMAEKYLDSLYLDKIFLENLKTAPGIGSPNIQGTKKIIQMCKNGFKALSYKQVSEKENLKENIDN